MSGERCAYCDRRATGLDAIGLPACSDHANEADEYFEQRTGRKPNDDPHLYCLQHGDMWEPGCTRCETNAQFHYGKSVTGFLNSDEAKCDILEATQ